MEKIDLPSQLVNSARLLLVVTKLVLYDNVLVDFFLYLIQVHDHAVLTQGLTKLRDEPRAWVEGGGGGGKREGGREREREGEREQ